MPFFVFAIFFQWKWQQFEVSCYRYSVIMWPIYCCYQTQMAGFPFEHSAAFTLFFFCVACVQCFGLMDGTLFIIMHCKVMYTSVMCMHCVWLPQYTHIFDTFSEQLHLPFTGFAANIQHICYCLP